jgi:intracellular septation protein
MTNAPDSAAPSKKELSPLLRLALEIGPLVIYFVTFQRLNDPDAAGGDFDALLMATGAFIVALAVSLTITWAKTRTLSRVAVLTAIIVVAMFLLTWLFGDETFVKMKATIVNGAFALILGIGLLQGRSFLKYLMGELIPLDDEGWIKFTRAWVMFFIFLAILNEVIWRSFSTETWLAAKFVNPVLSILFMVTQMPTLRKHMVEHQDGKRDA